MRRSEKSRKWDEREARFRAEDRAVSSLCKLPHQVALATAVTLEWFYAAGWWALQSEMIRQDDPREVVGISRNQFERARVAFCLKDGPWDGPALQHILDLFADCSPDWAWWIAHKVATWVKLNEWVFRLRERMPPLPALCSYRRVVKIPDAIKRAAAFGNNSHEIKLAVAETRRDVSMIGNR